MFLLILLWGREHYGVMLQVIQFIYTPSEYEP